MKDISRVTAVFVPCEEQIEPLKGTKKLYRQHRTELVVQDAYGQIYLTRQIFRQIV